MGIKDTFNFDDGAYEQKLRGMGTDQLQTREVVKIRQYISGSIGLGCILGAVVATMGTSLIVLPYLLRLINIAHRKLNIIRRVLFERGVPPYELTKRDLVIPLIVRAISLGLGAAVGNFIDITSVVPLDQVSPSGSDAVSSAINDPGATLNGFIAGVAQQGNAPAIDEIVSHAPASHDGFGHALATQHGAQSGFEHATDTSNPAYLVGMKQGASAASLGESRGVAMILSQLPLAVQPPWKMEKKEEDETPQRHISCDRCGKEFEALQTQHWHCRSCADGDFDICTQCYNTGERCLDGKHVMIKIPLEL